MSQIIVIGISGLDADLLRVYGPSLPNLRRLMLESPFLELKSTIPPEPIPAWTSVYTGLNPANHGLLEKMDCLERDIPDPQAGEGEMFWETAARAGKRVCVLNPLITGPVSTLEGLSLSPTYTSKTCSEELSSSTDHFPVLLDDPQIPPGSQLASFCDTLRERSEQQVTLALTQLAREPWDLFFVQLDALDHIQHFLWRYSDPSDPMYPGKNEHASRILDFYRFFDQVVGRFREVIHSDSSLVIVSSHGHERRCIYRLHINEWLRTQDFLAVEGQIYTQNHPSERSNRGLRAMLASTGLDSFMARLRQGSAKKVSSENSPELFSRRTLEKAFLDSSQKTHSYGRHFATRSKTAQNIDPHNTLAHLVELANASSYGGIALNRELIEREGQVYEQVREAILTGLKQLCINENPVVSWAKKREQCYQGIHLDRYPDILFELRSDFGVGRSLHASLVAYDSTHRLISGTHSAHGVFLLENWPEDLEIYEDLQGPTVMDVAPTILKLLDIEPGKLDGMPLVRPHAVRQLI